MAENKRQDETPHPDSFVRLRAVERFSGKSRTQIYADPDFPKPYKLGPRSSGWKWGELLEWARTRQPAGGDRGAR